MPDSDTVWLTPLPEMLAYLERAGLVVRWQDDRSWSHRALAESLGDAFAADAAKIAAEIGGRALGELIAAHRLWSDWLREGRVRKLAFVAEKTGIPGRGSCSIRGRQASGRPDGELLEPWLMPRKAEPRMMGRRGGVQGRAVEIAADAGR